MKLRHIFFTCRQKLLYQLDNEETGTALQSKACRFSQQPLKTTSFFSSSLPKPVFKLEKPSSENLEGYFRQFMEPLKLAFVCFSLEQFHQ